MILNVFLSKHVHINGQKHSSALEQFSFTLRFLG